MKALDEIRERWEKATPGPWRTARGGVMAGGVTVAMDIETDRDAVAIAHAPVDVSRLLTTVESLNDLATAFESEATASENTAKEILSSDPKRGWILVATEHEHHAVVARNHAKRIRRAVSAALGERA